MYTARLSLGALAMFTCGLATAAQEALTANRDALLDDIETVLSQQQVEITAQAQTNRFAIIYATSQQGSHVTITLRQTPLDETLIMLSVATDSPRDESYDSDLLQTFIQTQK